MPDAALEFTLHPDDLPRLAKLPFLMRAGRTAPAAMMWHDTADGALAARSLSLLEQRGRWRLEGLRPAPERPWPPGSPAPLVAQGASLGSIAGALPDEAPPSGLAPVAALRGRRLELALRPGADGPASGGATPGLRAPGCRAAENPDAGGSAPSASAEAGGDAAAGERSAGEMGAGEAGGAGGLEQPAGSVRITVLDGQLRGVAGERPACRVLLRGDPARLKPLALDMAASVRLSLPRAGMAASAIAVARGAVPAPRHQGPPLIVPGRPLTDTIALLVGQLVDTMLHWSAGASEGATPVPVHQMRVAIRRLRSAIAIFKRVAGGPDLAALNQALRETATRLGEARDWDVFLGGTAEQVVAAIPGEPRLRALLAAAKRRRQAGYAGLREHLGSAAFRELEVALGCACVLRPWDREPDPDPRLRADTALFAASALNRQMKRVRRAGRGLSDLPVEALHELRKDCKRLRYAAEFFLPLFPEAPGRRFVKRLAALQEELGTLNDAAVAAGLMAHLGRAERGYAAGLVEGYVAAGAMASRQHIGAAWKKFRKAAPFWE